MTKTMNIFGYFSLKRLKLKKLINSIFFVVDDVVYINDLAQNKTKQNLIFFYYFN